MVMEFLGFLYSHLSFQNMIIQRAGVDVWLNKGAKSS
jgi:hypothetical protein